MTQPQTPTPPSTIGGTLFGETLAAKQYLQPGERHLKDVFERVARVVASVEKPDEQVRWATTFAHMMTGGEFCPGGRVLAGAGTQHGNILNCFIQAADDMHTLPGVMALATKLALVSKVGGGNGTSLDDLRAYDGTRKVTGAHLRGVGRLFMTLPDDHPDADKFLDGETQDPAWPGNPVRPKRGYRAATVLTTDAAGRITRSSDPTLVGEWFSEVIAGDDDNPDLLVEDSIEGIMAAADEMCCELIEGGDVLVDLSNLRAEGSPVSGSGGHASGPHSFAVEIFDSFAHWCRLGGPDAGVVAALRYVMAATLRVIVQGGTRRGAGMATIRVDHPEILNFLTAKDRDRVAAEGDISTYNVSVKVTDDFMIKAENGGWIEITGHAGEPANLMDVPGKYSVDALIGMGVVEPLPDAKAGHGISAEWLLSEIAAHAHLAAEPGLLFIDRINDNAALPEGVSIQATNPCGEEPMTPGEACDLGALVVSAFVDRSGHFEWARFDQSIRNAVRFLDNVLDINVFALDDNREACLGYRRLGLGVMGLADALALMNLEYGSPESVAFCELLGEFMATIADGESRWLGRERGVPTQVAAAGLSRRNIAVLTVAPTGTTSNLMGCAGGIEPVFALKYERRVGSEFVTIVEPIARRLIERAGYDPVDVLSTGLSKDLEGHKETALSWLAPLLRTANELPWEAHVAVQGAVQRGFDAGGRGIANAISKTLNLPRGSTAQTVRDAYATSFRLGCKGVTVYVDGSYENQVLSAGGSPDDGQETRPTAEKFLEDRERDALISAAADAENVYDLDLLEAYAKEQARVTNENREAHPAQDVLDVAASWRVTESMPDYERESAPLLTAREIAEGFRFTRPKRLHGHTDQVALTDPSTGQKAKYLVTVNADESGRPVEIILTSGKGGSRTHGEAEAIGRLASIALQQGVAPGKISATLRGIDSGMYGSYGSRLINSPASLVAAALEEAVRPPAPQTLPVPEAAPAGPSRALSGPPCPVCSGTLVRREGCFQCAECSYSKCG